MEERINVLPVVEHIACVQIQSLVMQVACPEIRRLQIEIPMTFSQVASSLANNAPSSDMPTGDRRMLVCDFACWVSAIRILDATNVLCSGFDEDTA